MFRWMGGERGVTRKEKKQRKQKTRLRKEYDRHKLHASWLFFVWREKYFFFGKKNLGRK